MTDDPYAAVVEWWAPLAEHETGAARAARAQLRRGKLQTVLGHHYTHDLLRRLPGYAQKVCRQDPYQLITLATTLAHVQENNASSAAYFMGVGKGNPTISALRFDKIIRAEDAQTLGHVLRRVLPLIKRRANVQRLARDILNWNDHTRANWCFDYYKSDGPETPPPDAG